MFRLFSILLLLLPTVATAQEIDPRVAPQAVAAMQAMIALRDAQIKALQEDMAKREKDWAEYSRPLYDDKH